MKGEIDLSEMRTNNTRFLLTMAGGEWEANMPTDGETTLEKVRGLEDLHPRLQKIGKYWASLPFAQARSFEDEQMKEVARTLEIRFKKRVKLDDLYHAIGGLEIVKNIDTPAPRFLPEDADRFRMTS